MFSDGGLCLCITVEVWLVSQVLWALRDANVSNDSINILIKLFLSLRIFHAVYWARVQIDL